MLAKWYLHKTGCIYELSSVDCPTQATDAASAPVLECGQLASRGLGSWRVKPAKVGTSAGLVTDFVYGRAWYGER
jgi:hypothetical protein